nr:MAG TPA: peptidase [Caudoviricetes sp.]
MAVSVQKYMKNMVKSVAYSTTDVLSSKIEYVRDFKDENQEVFKEVYSTVRDYRNTYTRVKKAIVNSKVMDAARAGYDSVMYSITTGDFYAKNKETEIIEKYGGNLMADMDIDDDDFNWDNEDLSTGDKVIATAIKKNSKVGTAMTVEAIAQTGKAQMDVSKENTMLLYTQNERMINKLDAGFTNVLGFLKQNGEQTAKVQNQMNDNLNKFMTNVDNNVSKLTKQMDELLEMQRNMYNPKKADEKKRVTYNDIISRDGIINIKEYIKQVKKQGFDVINEKSGNMLSMLFGNTMGEGSNMLAQIAASPFRSLMTAMINKGLGANFDKATAELNKTLQGIIPTIIGKANAAGKRQDNGIMGFLGRIFGIRDKADESVNPANYNKNAIPFDGITKRAITDVIPTYLKKIAASLNGGVEMTYDFQTGRWTSMKNVKDAFDKTMNSANDSTAGLVISKLEKEMGGRRLNTVFESKIDYDRFMDSVKSYAKKLQSVGDFGSIKESDLSASELEVHKAMRRALRVEQDGKDRRFTTGANGKKIDSGLGRSDIGSFNMSLRQFRQAQNAAIKAINEGESVLRQVAAEGLGSIDSKKYFGKDISTINSHGDMTQRAVQELPMSQALIRAKDEYGITLYQYLRDMGASLRFIKANSLNLVNIPETEGSKDQKEGWKKVLQDGQIKYDDGPSEDYYLNYYEHKSFNARNKEGETYIRNLASAKESARKNGQTFTTATTTDFYSTDDKTGMYRIMSDYQSEAMSKAVIKDQQERSKKEAERWKKMESIFGKEKAQKYKEASDSFDAGASLSDNMSKVKDKGVGANIMMFTKWISSKVDKPSDVAADTILKVDYWLQKLIYGEDLKDDEQKIGLFGSIKNSIKNGFDLIADKVKEGFDNFKNKVLHPFYEKVLKKPMEALFGTKDENGVRGGGLLGNFIGGMQRGLRKNANDVFEYTKRNAKKVGKDIKDFLTPDEEQNKGPSEWEKGSKLNIRHMAVGGVNKTGKPFQSVLSAGELHNGVPVRSMGVYTINPGDTVVNPASASTRSKQARAERNYLNNIKRNAEANQKLSPDEQVPSETEQKEDPNKFAELMTNKDWTELTDKKQRAEFLGNVASRGLIGGGLGLLVGGPLLGAAVGAASSLTKSTDAFSSLLFGDAIKDKNGNVQVDEDGKIVRSDNGLISKEIMKAMPDVKKFGIGGAIAGLITPLGPLGGILAGSALGFAKNSEIFQGSLFGDGGIFSDKNVNKLKKGAKNIGAGAIIGAIAMPGPFGLLGNALIGATAGYITSTDKFKDALLGEKSDPNDPNSKRQGGIVGGIKDALRPMKDFGIHLRDNIMDEIFGKDEGDGRKGGLFGAIRDNMVTPIIEGGKSVFQTLQNNVSDMAHLLGDAYKKFKSMHAGKDFFGGLIEKADKLTGGAIKGAGSIGRAMTKPFRLLGDDGIGGMLTARRIKNGTEIGKSATQRNIFRTKHNLGIDDKYAKADQVMANMSREDLLMAQSLLEFGDNTNMIDQARDSDYAVLGQELRKNLNRSDAKKVIKLLKDGNIAEAQKFARTRKISDDSKKNVESLISNHQYKLDQYKSTKKRIESLGKDSQTILKDLGLKVDTKDPKSVRYLKKQLSKEIAHQDAGLTDEEIAFKKQEEMWKGKDSPLTVVNTGITTVVELLQQIKLGNEYDNLPASEKAKYSKTEYINSHKTTTDTETQVKKTAVGKGVQPSATVNPQANLYKKMEDIKNEEYMKSLKEVSDRGVRIFNNLVAEDLKDPEKIEFDIADQYSVSEDGSDGKPKYEPHKKLIRNIKITRFKKTYEFNVTYTCNEKGDVSLTADQEETFTIARDSFVSEYMRKFIPKDRKEIIKNMNFGDMIRTSVKAAGIIAIASVIPGGILAVGGFKLAKSINKRFDLTGKAKRLTKKGINKVSIGVKNKLGSHDLDMQSRHQKKKEKKYNKKANKALNEAIEHSDPRLDQIAQEQFGQNYNDLERNQKYTVNDIFREEVKNEKRSWQASGHGLLGNIKAVGKNIGTLKTRAFNAAKALKEKEQEKDNFIGKFFNKLDKWKIKHDKRKFEGKSSPLTKIIKWLFVGGIATPILVGFVKDKIMPAIHDKIQPWLKKAGEKIIGKKNQQTGEYEGGIVSGIVNPIRNFFKDKFQTVHDWIFNDGKFTSNDTGFKGFLGNFVNVFKYGVKLWESGAQTIISDILPGAVEALVSKLPAILKSVGKGIVDGIASWFGKKDGTGKQSLDKIDGTMVSGGGNNRTNTNTGSSTIEFNNTVGGKFSMEAPKYIGPRPDYSSIQVNDVLADTSQTKNKDGTTTITNKDNGKNVTTEKINDNEMVSAGVNASGTEIFYKLSDTNRTQPYSKTGDGQYLRIDNQTDVMNNALQDNTSFQEMIENNNASNAGVTNSYTGTTPGLDNAIKGTKIGTKALTSKSGAKGLTLAVKAGGKTIKTVGRVASIPVGGKRSIAGKIITKTTNGLGNVVEKGADKLSNGVFDIGQKITNKALSKSKTLQKVNELGLKINDSWMNKFGHGQTKLDALDRSIDRALEKGDTAKAEKLLDKATKVEDKINNGNVFSKFKDKTISKAKNSKPGQAVTKISEGAKNIKTKAKDVVKNTKPGQAATKVKGMADDAVKSVKGIFEKAKKSIIDWFKKLFKNGTFKKALKEAGQEASDEAIEKMAKESGEKLVKECAEEGAEKIAKAAGKNAIATASDATGIGVVINIAMAVADFALGMDDCRNILQITDKEIPIAWRIFAGLANALQDIPVVGILFGIIGAKNIVYFLIDILGPIIAPDATKKIREKQKQAEETVAEYNRQHNTNLTLEEYNNKFNKTFTSVTKGLAADAGSFMSGRDATVSQSMESRHIVEDAGKKVTKIRKKLEDIASHMWEKEGKKFKSFNLTKETYGTLCAEVINKIVMLLNGLDEDKLDKVLESAGKMRMNFAENAGSGIVKGFTFGVVDLDPFVDAWDDGYKGLSYLGLDEDKFENTDVVKCIGGIASVFVKSCGGAKLKGKIIDIVITTFGKGMAADGKKIGENEKKMVEESDKDIEEINKQYIAVQQQFKAEGKPQSAAINSNGNIVTNANANNKLSTTNLQTATSPLSKISNKFSEIINNAVGGFTGGLDNIEELFKSLSSKNKSTNEAIDAMTLLPTDKKYWKIELDSTNPFVSAIFNFMESMNRVVKAPFALAAASLGSGLEVISSNSADNGGSAQIVNDSSGNTGSSTASTNNASSGSTSSKSSGGFLSKVANKGKNILKKIGGAFKSLFGRGIDDTGYGDDPFHIYQRDYKRSYKTNGDTENQTVADSGCGPAAAASILRMYGKNGNMNNAVSYALNNNYKEVNGGTYPQYFNDYLNKNGISTNSNANNKDVVNSLIHNKPVILMGQDASNSGRTPYGSKYSHYVVARGLDSNGNVIVEDSEDKNGSTRYSLADTLRNSSVRITTGNGKYGRAKGTVLDNFVSGVNSVMASSVTNILGNLSSSIGYSNGSNNTSSSNNTGSSGTVIAGTNGTISDLTKDSDVKTKCGYTTEQLTAAIKSIHPEGCSAEQFPEAAINVEKSKGVNALFTIAVAIQEHGWNGKVGVNTTGGNWGNWNVFNIQGTPNTSNGRWKDYNNLTDAFGGFGDLIMGSTYYGAGLKTPEAIGNRYCPPNLAENANYKPWGVSVCEVAQNIVKHIPTSGSGRGNKIEPAINKKLINNVTDSISYGTVSALNGGSGKWGRDGEEDTTTTDAAVTTTNTSSSNSSSTSESAGLLSKLTEYTTNLTKGVFGDFYDALYGKTDTTTPTSGNNITGTLSSGDATANMKTLFSYFTSQGLSDNLAAGILGNIKAESGFNPNVLYGGATGTVFDQQSLAYGLIQWTGSDARASLYNWCTANNCDPDTLDGQAKWIVAQIKGINLNDETNTANASKFNGSTGRGTMTYNAQLFNARGSFETFNTYSIEKATKLWLECVERPGDVNSFLQARVENAKQILAECKGTNSGSGRGVVNKFLSKPNKLRKRFGRGVWGRDGKDDTTGVTYSSPIGPTKPTDESIETTTDETSTSTETATSSSSSANNNGSDTLLSKLTDYASKAVKGVYGDFYDALYGSDTSSSDPGSSGTNAAYKGGDVIYAAAMVFEALYNADPTLCYDSSCSKYNDLVCRDGTKLDHERPDCSGMMSAVIHYMGYYTQRWGENKEYTDSYHGEGFGTQNWTASGGNTCIYDSNGELSKDWVVLPADTEPQPGDIRFAKSHGHTDMFVFYGQGNYPRGFNAGSGDTGGSIGNGMYNSYCLAKYYLDNGNQLPDPSTVSAGRGQNGAGTITDDDTLLVLRYQGSGNGRFGRGSSRNTKPNFAKLNRIGIAKKKYTDHGLVSNIVAKDIDRNIKSGAYGRGKNNVELKPYDSIHTNSNYTASINNKKLSSNNYIGSPSTIGTSSSGNGIDLNQLISLISIIANNADKMDAILQLLGAIATNTQNTSTAISNNNKSKTTNNNGLSALRNALDSNSSGIDIANAVYQIAKS